MLTLATISAFRDLVKDADAPAVAYASCCGKPRAEAAMLRVVRPALAELLALAETCLQIEIANEQETGMGEMCDRVSALLLEMRHKFPQKAQPPARTDLAATLPHLDSGELADAGRLMGHGRRTP